MKDCKFRYYWQSDICDGWDCQNKDCPHDSCPHFSDDIEECKFCIVEEY